jgi:hypothetical protein
MSATIEEPKSVISKLDNFAGISLTDISAIDATALNATIGRVISESHVKPVPVASFASSI